MAFDRMSCLLLGLITLLGLADRNPQTLASDSLESCLASSEQTILLRQLNAPPKTKEQFESCREVSDDLPRADGVQGLHHGGKARLGCVELRVRGGRSRPSGRMAQLSMFVRSKHILMLRIG
jgi:hypothetical protein